jgi:polysaccharide pyruvyl transferase WcaK-like protein
LSADIVCSISGGDSFSDIYGVGRYLYVSLPQILVLLLQKPLVMLPQTYGPFKTMFARLVSKWMLRRTSSIYSRDQAGVDLVRNLLGSQANSARFAYDMGFALGSFPPSGPTCGLLDSLSAAGPIVGFNVSGLLYVGGYSRDNMFGLKSDYRNTVADVLRRLLAGNQIQVLLIPHVLGGHLESDITACQALYDEFSPLYPGRLHFIREQLDQHQTKYVIGHCDFFLGSRMHACIAALSQNVPALGLAYSDKFAGVLNSISQQFSVLDLRTTGSMEVAEAVARAFRDREKSRQELSATMPAVRQAVLNFFKRLETRGD